MPTPSIKFKKMLFSYDKETRRQILEPLVEWLRKQIPNDPNEVIAEMGKNEISPEEQAKYNEGMNYETELENLAKSGKGTFTSDEIRSSAPKCYKLILSTYDETGPNGIGTSRYTLIEDQSTKQTFNLKRK